MCGHYEVADMRQLKYHINNLRKGQKYYIRVASGNLKGYSVYKLSIPSFIVPSSKYVLICNFFIIVVLFHKLRYVISLH